MIRPRGMHYLVRISYGKLFELYFVPHKTLAQALQESRGV